MPAIGLSAVIIAANADEARVLAVRAAQGGSEALPSGPLEPDHRTLERGLRAWVERQTGQSLGYVEQLYTFGDRDRTETDGRFAVRAVSVAYLALVRGHRPAADAVWRDWYHYVPWEDWRHGRPALLAALEAPLRDWVRAASDTSERRIREERIALAFALEGSPWNEERVLERYELLYQARLVTEAWHEAGAPVPSGSIVVTGAAMALDHRRILATAIGRLRGKIKYRPVVFELMPPSFTLHQLQRTVEALAGVRLHKPNFRRLVESQGLVEETGGTASETGGRPARLMRFRREVLLERPAPGLRLSPPRQPRLP